MTLELSQVAQQVKAMGCSLAAQQPAHAETVQQAQTLLTEFSTRFSELHERIQHAERVQQTQRFDWVGAAPLDEPLADRYPLPACSEHLTVIASDGSQILPDPHAIALYYLINTGSIVYRHGSGRKPEQFRPRPQLFFEPADLFDEQGRLITPGEVHAQRDLAELNCLVNVAPAYARDYDEPVIALSDGQLTLRVIDLPFNQQESHQDQYLAMLDTLRQAHVTVAGYIDRPRSTFVLSLLHLASLRIEQITEETLRLSPFRYLTDSELFGHLASGERSAIFATRAKGLDKYTTTGHAIHFFYLNVSANATPRLARIEVPAWVVADKLKVDTLHAGIVRQARLTGGYPYVLARADELAVISSEERQAIETMLAVELRRQGFAPEISLKQRNKNAFRFGREYR